jgi:SMI1 / KNR4 family (SUKH-1)
MADLDEVIPPFDFDEALRIGPDERMRLCVDLVRERLSRSGVWFDSPPVPPTGASEDELLRLESDLGIPLPAEYRAFLANWRYLIVGDGLKVWGLEYDGLSIGWPWVSDQHRPGDWYLVFGDYWDYADGDQLMFDLSAPSQPVIAYLHEHGPRCDPFAPSFSLALWRMVHETRA